VTHLQADIHSKEANQQQMLTGTDYRLSPALIVGLEAWVAVWHSSQLHHPLSAILQSMEHTLTKCLELIMHSQLLASFDFSMAIAFYC
jgi:hypothetical protein